MENSRRNFLKRTGFAGLGIAGAGLIPACSAGSGPESGNERSSGKNWQEDLEWQRIKYGEWGGPGVDPRPGEMDTILLKDYAPKSSIVGQETMLSTPRFPVIDAHIHHYPARAEGDTREVLAEWVETMDEVGVEKSVLLTVATGEEFDRLVELYLTPYPDRFQLYCGLDMTDIQQADYPERAAAELERCYEMGARGIGELTDKGKGFTRDLELPAEDRLHPDDERLDLFWSKAAELNMPVNIHMADHPSAWEPLDIFQERTPDYQHFNLHGQDIVSYDELVETLGRTVRKHPDTTFIACHLANLGNDLGRAGQMLDENPNLYLDISARDYEVGRRPRAALKFLTAYPDRVLFGTDMGMQKSMYQAWWRLLESDDEYMAGRVWWPYYGLDLPDDLLRGLYHDNAERVMNWEPV